MQNCCHCASLNLAVSSLSCEGKGGGREGGMEGWRREQMNGLMNGMGREGSRTWSPNASSMTATKTFSTVNVTVGGWSELCAHGLLSRVRMLVMKGRGRGEARRGGA
jgi:hypothetical protein